MKLTLRKLIGSIIVFVMILMSQHITYGETKLDLSKEITSDDALEWISSIFTLNKDHLTHQSLALNQQTSLHLLTHAEGSIYYFVTQQHEQSNSPIIIELGFGSYSPYTAAIIANEEIRRIQDKTLTYYSPLESYWNVFYYDEKVYIDGSTGEWIPEVKKITSTNSSEYPIFGKGEFEVYQKQDFSLNDYSDLSWLIDTKGNPIEKKVLIASIPEKEVRFIGSKYQDLIQFSYPVTGYLINGEFTYIALYDEYSNVTRYLLYEDAIQYGNFFLN